MSRHSTRDLLPELFEKVQKRGFNRISAQTLLLFSVTPKLYNGVIYVVHVHILHLVVKAINDSKEEEWQFTISFFRWYLSKTKAILKGTDHL